MSFNDAPALFNNQNYACLYWLINFYRSYHSYQPFLSYSSVWLWKSTKTDSVDSQFFDPVVASNKLYLRYRISIQLDATNRKLKYIFPIRVTVYELQPGLTRNFLKKVTREMSDFLTRWLPLMTSTSDSVFQYSSMRKIENPNTFLLYGLPFMSYSPVWLEN